jgi:hypothetical protein
MSDTNFQPIFDYIDESEKRIKEELTSEITSQISLKIQRVQDTLDAFAKDHKDNNHKAKIIEAKAERIEHWVMKAAEKVEVPYKP